MNGPVPTTSTPPALRSLALFSDFGETWPAYGEERKSRNNPSGAFSVTFRVCGAVASAPSKLRSWTALTAAL